MFVFTFRDGKIDFNRVEFQTYLIVFE